MPMTMMKMMTSLKALSTATARPSMSMTTMTYLLPLLRLTAAVGRDGSEPAALSRRRAGG